MKDTRSFPFAFFEGNIVPIETAKVNIMTNALQYGNAIFGGIRGYTSSDKKHTYIFRLEDHYKRFLNSLKILNKSIRYDLGQLMHTTLELVRKNQPKTDYYLRPFAYGSDFFLSPDLAPLTFEFALYMIPLGEYLSITKGLKLAISNWVRINDNMIPSRAKISGGYINSSLARGDAANLGYDDALLMSADGHIAEGSGANFFIVRDGVLVTPPKYGDVLEGMTRRTILQLAHDLDIPTEERNIDRTEVYIADEAFLTGTGAQVAWVAEVDGRKIGTGKMGPITEKINKLFFSLVRGKQKKYSDWLTKV
ncbi:branched-chain amino acid transaminase [Candidatus Gottesmanbacteria bacterium]|nr:branched-chain amino acid transaminase [Candidatus Gottesmanbacteria bacterium]